MTRVGWDVHAKHSADVFEERGELHWRYITSLLPDGWSLAGKEVLDFGCGSGRILRAALAQDTGAHFTGFETHAKSVRWLQRHLSPAATIVQTGSWPPLPESASRFDLIYAFSVFTHLVESWSAWLLELHRVLKEDGYLVVTVVGPGHTWRDDQPFVERLVSMKVLYPWASWDKGGPLVLHSEWWLRAHWGRVFEIVHFERGDPAGGAPLFGQGIVVMRKRAVNLTVDELEALAPDEPRELDAALESIRLLRREVATAERIVRSKSWRYTAPLRAGARRLRARVRRG
jgi:SAM-dependent methyltransferase